MKLRLCLIFSLLMCALSAHSLTLLSPIQAEQLVSAVMSEDLEEAERIVDSLERPILISEASWHLFISKVPSGRQIDYLTSIVDRAEGIPKIPHCHFCNRMNMSGRMQWQWLYGKKGQERILLLPRSWGDID